jgi:REP element-mobilizing transposase RayT
MRKKVLVGQVKIRLAAILSEVATEKGWLIKGLEIELFACSYISRAWVVK